MEKKLANIDFDWYKHYPADNFTLLNRLSHTELGVYQRMRDQYWTGGNKLPRDVYQIVEMIGEKVFPWRKYGLPIPKGFDNEEVTAKAVENILAEFFTKDADGDWCHEDLDEYRAEHQEKFQKSRAGGLKRHATAVKDAKGKFTSVAGPGAGHKVQQEPRYIEKSREDKNR